MTKFSLNVRFEIVAVDRAKAFVNDIFVGNLRLMPVKNRHTKQDERRLTFRNHENPFKDVIRETPMIYITETTTVADVLDNHHAVAQITPVVIRNALRNNWGSIFPKDEIRMLAA